MLKCTAYLEDLVKHQGQGQGQSGDQDTSQGQDKERFRPVSHQPEASEVKAKPKKVPANSILSQQEVWETRIKPKQAPATKQQQPGAGRVRQKKKSVPSGSTSRGEGPALGNVTRARSEMALGRRASERT